MFYFGNHASKIAFATETELYWIEEHEEADGGFN